MEEKIKIDALTPKDEDKDIKCLCDECDCDECYDCGECTGYSEYSE